MLAFDQQSAFAQLDTWRNTPAGAPTDKKRPHKGATTAPLLRPLYWIYERRLLISSSRGQCRVMLASFWTEIADMLASEA
jgi:hypothetical protein